MTNYIINKIELLSCQQCYSAFLAILVTHPRNMQGQIFLHTIADMLDL
jgi:hypothetical protein